MVKYSDDSLDAIFSALADPTRRAILSRLTEGEVTVGELAEPFDMSLPAVSKHLRVLELAGLLVQEKDGRIRRCHLNAEPLQEAAEWISHYRQFWEEQFDQLSAFLKDIYDQSQKTT
jgi:DNA-binding transcriptional ArsR family regulator